MVSKEIIISNKQGVNSAKRSLVYFLIDGSEIVYVGQTTMGISRVLAHCGVKIFDSYSTIDCPASELDEMESNYIHKFNPKYNITLPYNKKYISKAKLKEEYRVAGSAMNKVMRLYGIKANDSGCYDRKEIEEALTKAKNENILRYDEGRNSDWHIA